jgi:tRNA pseudouridine55 synthase
MPRKGIEIEREPREVVIHELKFEWIRLPEACFTVRCSRGTYVRTLAHDLGEALGCGAHLLELRRTRSGLFREEDAVTLEALAEAADQQSLFVPVDRALGHLKALQLNEQGAKKAANGVAPTDEELTEPALAGLENGERVRLYAGERFAAVGENDRGKRLKLVRVFN